MADSRTECGSRDDLTVDASRCLKMRFSQSGCRRCADICPFKALSLDGFLSVNPNHCRGCLLCTAVCPVGALEQANDFSACLSQLSRVPEPVLGCSRTKAHSNATLACLGGLSEEHLLTLCHTLPGKMTLNLTSCSDCPNHSIIPHLRQRLEVLSEAGLLEGGCRIVAAESPRDITYREESLNRRSFFKSFRASLFQSAAAIISPSNEPVERRTEYTVKRLPVRRKLLNGIRKKLTRELAVRMERYFDSTAVFDDNCTKCLACVAICPTGALRRELGNGTPCFDHVICTGCGLCVEFCMVGALLISWKDL